jgi:hypothetical protein
MVFAHIKSPLPVGFIYQNTDLHSAPPHAGPCFSLKPANRTTLHAVSHQSHLSNLLKKKHPKDSPSSQVVPQDIPYSTSDLSHTVCPKFNSHVYKLKRWAIIDHICFYYATGIQRGPSIGGGYPTLQVLFLTISQTIWLLTKYIKIRIVNTALN